jgi:hypothetical protein
MTFMVNYDLVGEASFRRKYKESAVCWEKYRRESPPIHSLGWCQSRFISLGRGLRNYYRDFRNAKGRSWYTALTRCFSSLFISQGCYLQLSAHLNPSLLPHVLRYSQISELCKKIVSTTWWEVNIPHHCSVTKMKASTLHCHLCLLASSAFRGARWEWP